RAASGRPEGTGPATQGVHMRVLVAVALLSLVPGLALGQVPKKIGYQGRLLKADGTPEGGVVKITFSVYSAPTAGTAIWSEEQSLALTDGFYATFLGEVTTIPDTLFDGSVLYLELSTGGTAMTPRQKVGSVPYALLAQSVKGGSVDAANLSINGTPVIDATGKWVGLVTGLQGPKGDPGDKGDTGAQGIQGPPGADGAKGADGAPGAPGAPGTAGAPGATGPQGPAGIGRVASYEFEEAPGAATVADSSGAANTLTLNTLGTTLTTLGHTGNGLLLDGISGYAQAPDAPALNPREEVTVSAWVYQTGNATMNNCVAVKENQYVLSVNNGQLQMAIKTFKASGWSFNGSGPVPLNTWTHVAGSYDGVAIRTFVNGVMTSFTPFPNGIMATTNSGLRVGARGTGTAAPTELFTGRVDEVRVTGLAKHDQPVLSTLVTMAGPGLGDVRNNSGTAALNTWWDIPNRTVTFTKRFASSRLKITYQDTLGTLGPDYGTCIWRFLLDGSAIASFSDADLTAATAWRMTNAAHMAWATGTAGAHTVQVQGLRAGTATECLQGWNTNGNFLSVEEIP
ncbi:MAG: hypothetical protein HY901_06130, partial [Deltaproteobacteria bacterium]|nr:hypothetical protein [Deltaproteobacteria bacterium]